MTEIKALEIRLDEIDMSAAELIAAGLAKTKGSDQLNPVFAALCDDSMRLMGVSTYNIQAEDLAVSVRLDLVLWRAPKAAEAEGSEEG